MSRGRPPRTNIHVTGGLGSQERDYAKAMVEQERVNFPEPAPSPHSRTPSELPTKTDLITAMHFTVRMLETKAKINSQKQSQGQKRKHPQGSTKKDIS